MHISFKPAVAASQAIFLFSPVTIVAAREALAARSKKPRHVRGFLLFAASAHVVARRKPATPPGFSTRPRPGSPP
ncbi:hypothetical protein, partial [Paraburkholderia sp. J63]|uniref:hypothetical protein n=1 Tax=Paraburkholderia sp. J63 TaxID=2805434 RepID=UPI002ABD42F5